MLDSCSSHMWNKSDIDASWRKSIIFLLCLMILALFCASDACAGHSWKCEHMVRRRCRLIRTAPSVTVQPECFIIIIFIVIIGLSCENCLVSSLHNCCYCSFHLLSTKNRQKCRTQCTNLPLINLPCLWWTLFYWYWWFSVCSRNTFHTPAHFSSPKTAVFPLPLCRLTSAVRSGHCGCFSCEL